MSFCRVSCDQFTLGHNGNKLNDLSFPFCVIHDTDYMTFCLRFMDICFTCIMFKHFVHFMCVFCAMYFFYQNKLLLLIVYFIFIFSGTSTR